MAGEPTVHQGSSGHWVQQLQDGLVALGYQLHVDGHFGSATTEAVKSLQSANGLTADGVVGPRTWALLVGESGQWAHTGRADIAVNYDAQVVTAPTGSSAWAAALAMLLHYQGNYPSPEAVASEAGLDVNASAGWGEVDQAASRWGLSKFTGDCPAPDMLASWLDSSGPVAIVADPASRAALIVAVNGDGSPDETHVKYLSAGGHTMHKTFKEFDHEWGLTTASCVYYRG